MVAPEFGSASILLCMLIRWKTSTVKQPSPLFTKTLQLFVEQTDDFLVYFPKSNIGLYDGKYG
jgi:hypothetical protein